MRSRRKTLITSRVKLETQNVGRAIIGHEEIQAPERQHSEGQSQHRTYDGPRITCKDAAHWQSEAGQCRPYSLYGRTFGRIHPKTRKYDQWFHSQDLASRYTCICKLHKGKVSHVRVKEKLSPHN